MKTKLKLSLSDTHKRLKRYAISQRRIFISSRLCSNKRHVEQATTNEIS